MRNAEVILGVIRNRGSRGLPLERVYRLLFSQELFLLAYGRIARIAELSHLALRTRLRME